MGFLRKVLEALELKEKYCEQHCKICKIKKCCVNCLYAMPYKENIGTFDKRILRQHIICDFGLVSRKQGFPTYQPVFVNCGKWKPRYPKNFK